MIIGDRHRDLFLHSCRPDLRDTRRKPSCSEKFYASGGILYVDTCYDKTSLNIKLDFHAGPAPDSPISSRGPLLSPSGAR